VRHAGQTNSRDRGRSAAVGDLDVRLAAGARPILERELSRTERAAFVTYMELLLTWQRIYRLVGSSDRRWIIDELILDSLFVCPLSPGSSQVGPRPRFWRRDSGIPLGIVRPMVRFTLLEPVADERRFFGAAIRALELENTESSHSEPKTPSTASELKAGSTSS